MALPGQVPYGLEVSPHMPPCSLGVHSQNGNGCFSSGVVKKGGQCWVPEVASSSSSRGWVSERHWRAAEQQGLAC